MGCGCNDKKKACDKGEFPQAVIEIKNPSQLLEFRKVVVKASLGDDTTYPPKVGMFCNTILYYEANDQVYLYSSDGIPTKVTVDVEELKKQIKQVSDALADEVQNRVDADNAIWEEIEEIEMSSDVVDIVGTYAELQQYDTSKLHDNDIIKVLQDSTHQDETAYYRWSTTTSTFSYVGSEGPYYTESQIDTMMAGKQDKLIAGSNIQIASDGKTISATDTTYSPFVGATSSVAGSAGLVPAPTTADPNKYLKGDGTWDDSWNNKVDSLVLYIHKTGGTFDGLYKDAQFTEKIYGYEVEAIFPNTRLFVTYTGGYYSIDPVIRVSDSDEGYHSIATITTPGSGSYPPDSWTSLAEEILFIPSDLAHEQDVGGMNIYQIQKTNIQNQLTAGNNISFTNGGSVINAVDTTYSAFTGATSSVAGTAGLVPAPTTSDPDKFLKGDGTWATVSGGSSNVTTFYTDESLGTFYKDAARTQVATYAEVYDSFGADKIVKAITSNIDDYCETYEYIIMPVYELQNCSYSDTPEIKYLTGTTFRRPGNYGSDNGVILRTLEPRTDSAGYPQAQAVFDEEVHPAQEFLRTLYLRNVGGTSNYSLTFPTSQIALDKPTIYTMLDRNKSMYIEDSGKNVIVSWKFATMLPQQTAEDTYIIYAKKNDLSDTIELWKLTLASPQYDTLWERTKIATIGNFTGATSSVAGESGLVPAPAAGDQDKFLKGDGTWAAIPTNNISSNDWSALWQ